MTSARKLFTLSLLTAFCAVAAWAQPRPVANTPAPAAQSSNAPAQPAATPRPAPPTTLKAKYEGGVFGYTKKQEGTLNFDEVNSRLVFRGKDGKEMLSFPYSSLRLIFPDTKAVRPAAATVVGSIPLPYGANIPAWFVRKKQRYLNFQYDAVNVSGGASFKLPSKEVLASVVAALCEKGELKIQGDACYRDSRGVSSSAVAVPLPTPEK
jgi:hypothetical protein